MIVSSPRENKSERDDETIEGAFDATTEEFDGPRLSMKRLQEGKEAIKYDVDDLACGTDGSRSIVVTIHLS